MNRMIVFELKKIWDKKLLMGLMLILLVASGVFFHLYEQKQPVYRYIYQGKAEYERFLQGDDSADIYGVYAENVEKQLNHKESYPVFLSEMEERAQKTMLLLGNLDSKSYVYTNAQKTCEDFQGLIGIEIVADNCYGIMELARYDLGIYFVIGCVGVLSYFVFFEERKNGMLLLVKGTKEGHTPLVRIKLFVMTIGGVVFALLQEILLVIMTEYYYGFGDLGRSIQSIPEFRNCPFEISVGEGIFILVLTRLWIAIVITVFVGMISITVRNELVAITTLVVFFGIELILSQGLSLTGSLNFLKCINPFFAWNMINLLATYLNLNILGNAIGKGIAALVVSVIWVAVCIRVGEIVFHRRYQIRTQSKLDKLALWWRRKTAFLWKNVHLLVFELYKILLQQKRIFLVLLITVLCILQVNELGEVRYYDNAYEATYNSYLRKISGKVTQESIAFIEAEQAYVIELKTRIDSLEDPEGKDYGLALQLGLELRLKEEAVNMLVTQYNSLEEMPGSIYDKYFINESAYLGYFYDAGAHGMWWFICMASIVVWLSGVFPADRNKEVYLLVQTTLNGREKLDVYKNGTVAIGALLFFGATEVLKIVELYYLDGFRCIGKPLAEFTSVTFATNMTIGMLYVWIMSVRAMSVIAITFLTTYFSKKTANGIITNIVGIGVVGAIAFVCIRFNVSISTWILNLMYV